MEWISFLAGVFFGATGLYLRFQSRRYHYRSHIFQTKIECYNKLTLAIDHCWGSIHQLHLFASVAVANVEQDHQLQKAWEVMGRVGEATSNSGIHPPNAGNSDFATDHGIWTRKFVPREITSQVDQDSLTYVRGLFKRMKQLHQAVKDSHKLLIDAHREARLILAPDTLKIIDNAFRSVGTSYDNISSFYDKALIDNDGLHECLHTLKATSRHLVVTARKEIGIDALDDEISKDLLVAKQSFVHKQNAIRN